MNTRKRSGIMSQDHQEQLEELDDIKVKTMYQMVEDIEVSTGGLAVSKKFLYLTNKQAASFNATNMDNVLQALELPESHFVIRLVPSLNGMAQYHAHKEDRGTIDERLNMPPTFNREDCDRSESQLILFIKNCILPVAMQTRALILCGGANDCSLAVAVQKVMGPVLERMGKDCPFTIIGMCFEPEVHAKAHEGSHSIAGQIAAQSKTWGRRFSDVHDCLITIDPDINDFQQCDLNSACTHLIVFETLNLEQQRWDTAARISFENTFVECMIQKLPSIVIQGQNSDIGIQNLGDIVRRKIPLLLLDSRERWPHITPEENPNHVKNPVTDLARETNALQPPDVTKHPHFDKAVVAEEMLRKHFKTLADTEDGGIFESWNTCTLSFLRSLRDFTSKHRKNERPQRRLCLFDAIAAENEALAGSSGFAGIHSTIHDDQDEKNLAHLYFKLDSEFKIPTKINQLKAYIKGRDPKWAEGDFAAFGEESKGLLKDKRLDEAKNKLQQFETFHKQTKGKTNRSIDQWTAVYDILTSKNCFADSIYDLQGISLIMNNVARIDNLPDKHTREALSLIQHAWCLVDSYHSSAVFNKWTAKICYVIMLLASIGVVGVGLMMTHGSPLPVERSMGNYLIVGLSLINTVIAGLTSFLNPASRWHYLRSAALEIESEVWQFRTRTGKYRNVRSATSRNAEKTFHKTLKESEETTLQSGDMRHTTFYSKPKSMWKRHGQFGDKALCCCLCRSTVKQKLKVSPLEEVDNHHSPLRPEEYLKFRLQPMLKFYRHRLPAYSRNRATTKIMTILGSIGSSVLAVFELSRYSVLMVVVVSSIVAWSEFSGTEKKLERYSTAVNCLTQVDLWWHALPEVERLATKSIDKLVDIVETHIRSERQGWKATSQATKMLQQAADNAKKLPRSNSEQSYMISSPVKSP
eukprot:g12913.t1